MLRYVGQGPRKAEPRDASQRGFGAWPGPAPLLRILGPLPNTPKQAEQRRPKPSYVASSHVVVHSLEPFATSGSNKRAAVLVHHETHPGSDSQMRLCTILTLCLDSSRREIQNIMYLMTVQVGRHDSPYLLTPFVGILMPSLIAAMNDTGHDRGWALTSD